MKILVVDDDASELLAIHKTLFDYDIITANSYKELSRVSERVDILVVDLFMSPAMNAETVIERVRENNKRVKTILHTCVPSGRQLRDAKAVTDYVVDKTLNYTELRAVLKKLGAKRG